MGLLLQTFQRETMAIQTLEHRRKPLSIGIHSQEFATDI
jgi:hypothetical protein